MRPLPSATREIPVYSHVAEPPISARAAVASIQDYAALRVHDGAVIGVSFDAETGLNQLCRFEGGRAISLLPQAFSVRSRVHEYGGGAWCIAGSHACFVNDIDQQIWLLPLEAAGTPRRLTRAADTRFADLHYDRYRDRLLAVSETRCSSVCEPVNRLVSIDLQTGGVAVVAEGADFYSSPALCPDGRQLAWIEWDHPRQPWLCTRLMLAQLDRQGRVELCERISDEQEAAWAQPRFSPEGQLHAVVDRDGWWRIETYTAAGFAPLSGNTPEITEFATAPWQFGLATYGWCADGALLALGQSEGYSRVWRHDARGWHSVELGIMPARLHALACAGNRIACVAEFSDRLPAVLSIDTELAADDPDQCTLLHGGQMPVYPPSLPVSQFAEVENTRVPYFLYRPAGVHSNQALPLVIWTHGGPTAATYPVFKPIVQYWTQHGFMIADVNYRGSTGYGRDYRLQLAGQWGVRDVGDVEAVARDLITQGLADAGAVFIRGNSAGGYTALNALSHSDVFSGGASLYGVSDPARLNQLTHKFESRYLHWLIGDPAKAHKRYRQRSPLDHAHQIRVPVIFFQGERDQVVLPEQTHRMAECLTLNGIRVETHYFEEEAHGFRQPDNQAAVLVHELAFYRSIIDQEKAGACEAPGAPCISPARD